MLLLKFLDLRGEALRTEQMVLGYEADKLIEASRDDATVFAWEIMDAQGSVAYLEKEEGQIFLIEKTDRYTGSNWDPTPLKWNKPWSWAYKHPELPEWRCRAENHAEAARLFRQIWAEQHHKGRLWNVEGKFHDGKVYKREKGSRKDRRRGVPD